MDECFCLICRDSFCMYVDIIYSRLILQSILFYSRGHAKKTGNQCKKGKRKL